LWVWAPKDYCEWQENPVSLFAQAKIWFVVKSRVAVEVAEKPCSLVDG